jgi:hypothetical protein
MLREINKTTCSICKLVLLLELALHKSNSESWSRTKRISSSSHWKLTCSRHDIDEQLLSWRKATTTFILLIANLAEKILIYINCRRNWHFILLVQEKNGDERTWPLVRYNCSCCIFCTGNDNQRLCNWYVLLLR